MTINNIIGYKYDQEWDRAFGTNVCIGIFCGMRTTYCAGTARERVNCELTF